MILDQKQKFFSHFPISKSQLSCFFKFQFSVAFAKYSSSLSKVSTSLKITSSSVRTIGASTSDWPQISNLLWRRQSSFLRPTPAEIVQQSVFFQQIKGEKRGRRCCSFPLLRNPFSFSFSLTAVFFGWERQEFHVLFTHCPPRFLPFFCSLVSWSSPCPDKFSLVSSFRCRLFHPVFVWFDGGRRLDKAAGFLGKTLQDCFVKFEIWICWIWEIEKFIVGRGDFAFFTSRLVVGSTE